MIMLSLLTQTPPAGHSPRRGTSYLDWKLNVISGTRCKWKYRLSQPDTAGQPAHRLELYKHKNRFHNVGKMNVKLIRKWIKYPDVTNTAAKLSRFPGPETVSDYRKLKGWDKFYFLRPAVPVRWRHESPQHSGNSPLSPSSPAWWVSPSCYSLHLLPADALEIATNSTLNWFGVSMTKNAFDVIHK